MRFVAALAAFVILGPGAGGADKLTTELLAAAQAGDIDKPQRLIAFGADVNAKGRGGMTPLLAAIAHGTPTTVKLLLNKGARVDARDERAATRCSLRRAISAGADVNIKGRDGRTALSWAKESKVKVIVDALVTAGPSRDGRECRRRLAWRQ